MIYLLQVIIKNFICDKESKTKEIIGSGARIWRNIMKVYGTFVAPIVLFFDQLSSINFAYNLSQKNVFEVLKYFAVVLIILPAMLNWKHMFNFVYNPRSKTPESRLLNVMQEKYFGQRKS